MRIRSVEAIPLEVPLGRVYRGSTYYVDRRCTVVTRIYTDDGLIGESYNGDERYYQAEVVRIIREEIAPWLAGEDPANPERCWEGLSGFVRGGSHRQELILQAISCVDSALWDLFGKALNVPLYRLWGGYRDELPVIAIGGYYEEGKTLRDIGEEMVALRELGVAGCKFKVGGLSPAEDAERVRVAREAAGPDFILVVDANRGWGAREAIEFARRVADLGVGWFEEPCADRLEMALVRNIGGIPVTAGQSEVTRAGCRDLMLAGAIDICNFDASWGGGPTEWRRVAMLAACFNVKMAHHEEPQIASHLLAAIPHGTYLEVFHPEWDPIFYQLIANRPRFKDGRFRLPERPGWGWELDQEVITRYRAG